MSEGGVREMLTELRGLREQAAGGVAHNSVSTSEKTFSEVLHAAILDVSEAQTEASRATEDFQLGIGNKELPEVVIDMQKSRLKFQLALQVRNRVVSAYQDVMNMPL